MIKLITGIITIFVTGTAFVISIASPSNETPEIHRGFDEFRYVWVGQVHATSRKVDEWNDQLRSFDIDNDYKYFQLTNTLRREVVGQKEVLKSLIIDWTNASNWPADSVQLQHDLKMLQEQHETLARRIDMVTEYE